MPYKNIYIYNKAYEFFVFGNGQQILSAEFPLKYIPTVSFKRGIEDLLEYIDKKKE